MIGKIKGIVDYIDQHTAIIDVGGVGYIIYCPSKALARLNIGMSAELFIETHVREDRITLFGFLAVKEKACFLKLLTVKGVGPKMGLQILGGLEPDQIYLAIQLKDSAMFSQINGVGPKIVGRIFAELKDVGADLGGPSCSTDTTTSLYHNHVVNLKNDAISALINLGMNKSEAHSTVADILDREADVDLNRLIKMALNTMAR